jgi:hypothetical protein
MTYLGNQKTNENGPWALFLLKQKEELFFNVLSQRAPMRGGARRCQLWHAALQRRRRRHSFETALPCPQAILEPERQINERRDEEDDDEGNLKVKLKR